MTMVVAQNPVVQASKTLENLGYLDHTLRIAVLGQGGTSREAQQPKVESIGENYVELSYDYGTMWNPYNT